MATVTPRDLDQATTVADDDRIEFYDKSEDDNKYIETDDLATYVTGKTVGSLAGQTVKAWINFNGSTGAINDSYNVTSLTKNSTGDYTINFTNALGNADYVTTINILSVVATGGGTSMPFQNTKSQTTTSCTVNTFSYTGSSNTTAVVDQTEIHVAVFGG